MTTNLQSIRLAGLTIPAKLLVTCILLTLGTGYLFALSNVALQIGFTNDEVALHYYGNETSRAAIEALNDRQTDAEESEIVEEEAFSFDDLDEADAEPEEAIVPVPSLGKLVAEGHFHLFGYTSIFALCGLIILFADLKRWLKNTLIVAPFAASVLDIWSMLLTRFVGSGFAWMLMVSGMVMALSFLLVFVIGIYQTWFLKPQVLPNA